MNIIVPVDFSTPSLNAAHFAARMLVGQYEATLTLFHAYQSETEAADVRNDLSKLKDALIDENIIKIECKALQSDDFIESLDKFVRHTGASLLVMSVSMKSRLEQAITNSNSLRMIERNVCPVLVIPPDAKFNQIRNVALASDFQDVEHSIPLVPVKNILSLFKPALHIVNINSEIYISLDEEYLRQRSQLQQMFAEFHPEFYFITTFDFHESLRQFIADKNIDLVITFPRSHSFINNLVKGNNTRKLVYESAIPVLAAHE